MSLVHVIRISLLQGAKCQEEGRAGQYQSPVTFDRFQQKLLMLSAKALSQFTRPEITTALAVQETFK